VTPMSPSVTTRRVAFADSAMADALNLVWRAGDLRESKVCAEPHQVEIGPRFRGDSSPWPVTALISVPLPSDVVPPQSDLTSSRAGAPHYLILVELMASGREDRLAGRNRRHDRFGQGLDPGDLRISSG
jgi:hypothetical protein